MKFGEIGVAIVISYFGVAQHHGWAVLCYVVIDDLTEEPFLGS